jgi:hypothetical protein
MGLLIDGAMQQALQAGRQFIQRPSLAKSNAAAPAWGLKLASK